MALEGRVTTEKDRVRYYVCVVGGKRVMHGSKSLARAMATARSWAISGWPCFVWQQRTGEFYPRMSMIELSKDMSVTRHGAHRSWMDQAEDIIQEVGS